MSTTLVAVFVTIGFYWWFNRYLVRRVRIHSSKAPVILSRGRRLNVKPNDVLRMLRSRGEGKRPRFEKWLGRTLQSAQRRLST